MALLCSWCGRAIEGEPHYTDIGTLCDLCVETLVPHYCVECGKKLPLGIYYNACVTETMDALVCKECYHALNAKKRGARP